MTTHRVLVISHEPTPLLSELRSLVSDGALDPSIGGVNVQNVMALDAVAGDVLAADGLVLITPANFGYMSGALKHFFDTVFRECEPTTPGLPVGVVVRGESDGTGAVESIRRIVVALRWRLIGDPVVIVGDPTDDDRAALHDLGATMSALLTTGIG